MLIEFSARVAGGKKGGGANSLFCPWSPSDVIVRLLQGCIEDKKFWESFPIIFLNDFYSCQDFSRNLALSYITCNSKDYVWQCGGESCGAETFWDRLQLQVFQNT